LSQPACGIRSTGDLCQIRDDHIHSIALTNITQETDF
jgi:hypothetical protein